MRWRPASGGGRRERGFALLVVLWSLVLLALIVTQVTASGRAETRLAGNIRDAAAADAAADGVVYEAISHLLDRSARRWRATGGPYAVPVVGGVATVAIASENGKFDLNSVPVDVLSALLQAVGAPAGTAEQLALGIAAWRAPSGDGAVRRDYAAAGLGYAPPEEPFASVAELGLVLGMTPGLVAQLRPHLTVYHDGDPDPAVADPVVRDILRMQDDAVTRPQQEDGPGEVVDITATVRLAAGSVAGRRAVVRVAAGADHGGWRILDWE